MIQIYFLTVLVISTFSKVDTMLVDPVMPQYTKLSSLLPTATAHPSVAPIVSVALRSPDSFKLLCFGSIGRPIFLKGTQANKGFVQPTVIPDLPVYQELGHVGHVALWVGFVIMLLSTLAFISMAWRVPVVRQFLPH